MLSLVKVDPAVPCEICGLGRKANNHVYLAGHHYAFMCHECLMDQTQIAIDNAPVFGTVDKDQIDYDSKEHIRAHEVAA